MLFLSRRLLNIEVGIRPAQIMRAFCLALCHQASRPVPTAVGNQLVNPFFVGLGLLLLRSIIEAFFESFKVVSIARRVSVYHD
jgi:hypothetical protein